MFKGQGAAGVWGVPLWPVTSISVYGHVCMDVTGPQGTRSGLHSLPLTLTGSSPLRIIGQKPGGSCMAARGERTLSNRRARRRCGVGGVGTPPTRRHIPYPQHWP